MQFGSKLNDQKMVEEPNANIVLRWSTQPPLDRRSQQNGFLSQTLAVIFKLEFQILEMFQIFVTMNSDWDFQLFRHVFDKPFLCFKHLKHKFHKILFFRTLLFGYVSP